MPTDQSAKSAVQHDPSQQRFFVSFPGGSDAVLAYAPIGADVLDLRHTIVPPEEQGRGVGESLVRAALAHARRERLRVVPTCHFVQAYLDAHPEEQELVSTP